MHAIRFDENAIGELRRIRAFERATILNEIEKQLGRNPSREGARKKMLVGLVPPWDQARPVWQLRVGDHRVFYDVAEEERIVIVRAIRHKGRKGTEEIL